MSLTLEQLTRWKVQRAAAFSRWKAGHRDQVNLRRRARNRERLQDRPWLFVDGEGWGVDVLGRQCYRMMVAATADGFEDSILARGERLTTVECLEWLCWLHDHYRSWCKRHHHAYIKPNLAGFGLGYDYAHILLDLNLEQLADVFHNQDHEAPWVEFDGGGDVGPAPEVKNSAGGSSPRSPHPTYLLKLTAGHLQVKRRIAGKQAGYAGVWDVYRYFKGSFAKASDHLMTAEERAIIDAGKARRGIDSHDTQEELEYSLTECKVGSRLIKNLEKQGRALELYPTSWYGPGSLAHLALKNQGAANYYKRDDEHNPALIDAARRAFVGGRFETTGHGRLPFLMEYDIKSAYPSAITHLPCLQHTTWQHLERGAVSATLDLTNGNGSGLPFWTLYHVRWDHHGVPLAGGWGPWPCRVQPGKVSESEDGFDAQMLPVWPWAGETWVWGPELRAGIKLLQHSPKATGRILEAWVPTTTCSCRPFDWVGEWYLRRQEMVANGDPREHWIKVIVNSLYGKMAQTVGKPQWHSWLWAGMITAHTRAQLLDAIAQDPEAVVMTATDAVYSIRGLDLPISASLGDWEGQALGSAFVVQSGFFDSQAIYGDGHPRTRGLPARYIEWARFQKLWDQVLTKKVKWNEAKVVVDADPATGKPFQIHVGIGLAQLWGKPEKLGQWMNYPTTLTFATDKRPARWKGGDRGREWYGTKPWALSNNPGETYRPGRGIGEDKFSVMDQPDASEWGISDG